MGLGYFLLGTAAGVGVGYFVWGRMQAHETLLITAPPRVEAEAAQLPAPTTQGGFAPTTAVIREEPQGAITGGRQTVIEEPVVSAGLVMEGTVPGSTQPSTPMGDFGMPDPQWRFRLNPYMFRPQVTIRTFTSPEYGARLQYNSASDQDALFAQYGVRVKPRNVWMRGNPDASATFALMSPGGTMFYQSKNRQEAEMILDLLIKQARAELYADAIANASNKVR